MAKSGKASGEFILIIDQDGKKMAFSSREIKNIEFDGKNLRVDLKQPKYQIEYKKYIELFKQGADSAAVDAIRLGVQSGAISIV